MNRLLMKIADNSKKDSLSTNYRTKRFNKFLEMIDERSGQKILDVGGTELFWDVMGSDLTQHYVTLLNLEKCETKRNNFQSIKGDARDLSAFSNEYFDVVFSNSVIEHVGGLNDQRAMSNEIRRVSKKYFIQTPNYFFPIEPHFLFPAFHWLPLFIRILLVRCFKLGWMPRAHSINEAKKIVSEIRLLSKKEMKDLFPDAFIWEEKILGLTKSFVAIRK